MSWNGHHIPCVELVTHSLWRKNDRRIERVFTVRRRVRGKVDEGKPLGVSGSVGVGLCRGTCEHQLRVGTELLLDPLDFQPRVEKLRKMLLIRVGGVANQQQRRRLRPERSGTVYQRAERRGD